MLTLDVPVLLSALSPQVLVIGDYGTVIARCCCALHLPACLLASCSTALRTFLVLSLRSNAQHTAQTESPSQPGLYTARHGVSAGVGKTSVIRRYTEVRAAHALLLVRCTMLLLNRTHSAHCTTVREYI